MNYEKYLPKDFCDWLRLYAADASDITLILNRNMFISCKGSIKQSPCMTTEEILAKVLNKLCNGSIYANQGTLKKGYITIDGGSRVGVTGTAVTDDDGKVVYMRDITSINIRIKRNVLGAADGIMQHIAIGNTIYNTLIIGPPSSGKTTALQDIARQLGNRFKVGIADERSEIAQDGDMGKHTFYLKGASKNEAITMLLRSMAPQVIITDEIGTIEDEIALEKLINAGVKVICSAHGFDESDLARRPVFKSLFENGVFERIIVLSDRLGYGTAEKIIDTRGWKQLA